MSLTRQCNTGEECLWSLCLLVIAWRDACFRGYVTSKSVNNLHENTFQIFCLYVYLNLSMQKDIIIFYQGISTNRHGLEVWQRDKYTRVTRKRWFKSRRLPRKKGKRKKETWGHWREWSVNERGKKRKRGVEKDIKKGRKWNPLLLMQ